MIIGNRLVKILFASLAAIILTVNIVYWANSPDVSMAIILDPLNMTFGQVQSRHSSFIGFTQIFRFIETFPGLNYTIAMLNNYGNIVSNYHVTNNNILDFLGAIFRMLTTPMLFSVTIVADIVRNAIWFIRLITGNIV